MYKRLASIFYVNIEFTILDYDGNSVNIPQDGNTVNIGCDLRSLIGNLG